MLPTLFLSVVNTMAAPGLPLDSNVPPPPPPAPPRPGSAAPPSGTRFSFRMFFSSSTLGLYAPWLTMCSSRA